MRSPPAASTPFEQDQPGERFIFGLPNIGNAKPLLSYLYGKSPVQCPMTKIFTSGTWFPGTEDKPPTPTGLPSPGSALRETGGKRGLCVRVSNRESRRMKHPHSLPFCPLLVSFPEKAQMRYCAASCAGDILPSASPTRGR